MFVHWLILKSYVMSLIENGSQSAQILDYRTINSSGITGISSLCQSVLWIWVLESGGENKWDISTLSWDTYWHTIINSEHWLKSVSVFDSYLPQLSSVSNNVQDGSYCDYLLFYLASCRSAPAAPKALAWPLAVSFHHIFWPLPCLLPGFWNLCSSILHQLSAAVLRNSTAYQHSSNATFYRCIGHGCTRVLQFRKYNRLAVHVSVSRCGGSVSESRVYKRELCCFDR